MSSRAMSRPAQAARTALVPILIGMLAALGATVSHADSHFIYDGEPIHPACVHAIAMHGEEQLPVTTAVSIEGCAASGRTASHVHYEGMIAYFEDDELLGGGSFGYREIGRLDNGIVGLALRRVYPDGSERVSLAAVQVVERPMMRRGQISRLTQVELLGEIWLPSIDIWSMRVVGNVVEFSSGAGREKLHQRVDFTRLGKLRR